MFTRTRQISGKFPVSYVFQNNMSKTAAMSNIS